MHRLRILALCALLALVAVATGAGPARAVAVSVGTGSGLAGQTVDIDLNTASLTGLNVLSLQFTLGYNPNVVTPVDVIIAGGLTGNAAWNTPSFHANNVGGSGTLSVSDAGTTALTGAGSMLKVRFLINPALLNGSSTSLILSNVIFNEGTPTVTTTNGSISVGVTPQIDVTPDAGEVIRGQTLQFTASGSVTNPMSWTTSNFNLATISATGLLTGVAPGSVTVTGTDAALHSSTTSGTILIRGMGITAGTATVFPNQPITIPITVTTLSGLGIRSGQFTLGWNTAIATATSITTPAGTLLNGWGPVAMAPSATGCTVDFAGSSDLNGAGVLCYLNLTPRPNVTGGSAISFTTAVFNEVMPAKPTTGSFNVQTLPTITVSPDVVSLLAGQTQQYTVSGSPTLPITWSVEDPSLATISATGLLTAQHGGVTRVRAQDALGAVDFTSSLTIYDLQVTMGSVNGPPGATIKVPLTSDRVVGGLGIYSMQFAVDWSGANIVGGVASPSGLWGQWGGGIVSHFDNAFTELDCAAGGTSTLANTGTSLASFMLTISPAAVTGTNIPLTLSRLVFNEGLPKPLIVNGTVHVLNSADAPPPAAVAEFALRACEPNPARAGAVRIPFSLPEGGGRVQLGVFGLDGRRVRGLVDGALPAGPHEALWDGRDDGGRPVSAGLYFTRLEHGARVASRKLTLID